MPLMGAGQRHRNTRDKTWHAFSSGHYSVALQMVENSEEFAPEERMFLQGICYYHLNVPNLAIYHLSRITKNKDACSLYLAKSFELAQQYADAMFHYRSYSNTAEGRHDLEARLGMGRCYYFVGDYEESITTYQAILSSLSPTHPAYNDIVYSVAVSHVALNNLDRAFIRIAQIESLQIKMEMYSALAEHCKTIGKYSAAATIESLAKRVQKTMHVVEKVPTSREELVKSTVERSRSKSHSPALFAPVSMPIRLNPHLATYAHEVKRLDTHRMQLEALDLATPLKRPR